MKIIAYVLITVALLAVLATLIMGITALGNSSEEARVRSNNLMRWRVILQAVAIGVLLLGFALLSAAD